VRFTSVSSVEIKITARGGKRKALKERIAETHKASRRKFVEVSKELIYSLEFDIPDWFLTGLWILEKIYLL